MIVKPKSQRQLKQEELQASFAELKARTLYNYSEIAIWLQQNLNLLSSAYFHLSSRKLSSTGTHYGQFEMEGKIPCFVMSCEWRYENMRSFPIDARGLAAFLPNIVIQQTPDSIHSDTLAITVTVDLADWPGLVPCLLGEDLYHAFVNPEMTPYDKTEAEKRAQLLLDHFYPSSSIELYKNAADLGMIDSDSKTFVSWFQGNLNAASAVLPVGIDYAATT